MTEPAFIIKTNAAGVDVYHANPKYEPVDEDDEEFMEAPVTGPPPVPPLPTMNILIIESTSKTKPLATDYSDTAIVHCRNSLILAKELGADLLDGVYCLDKILEKTYDVIICAYASPYMPYREYEAVLEKNPNARYVWLVNDHDLEDNQLLRSWVINHGGSYDVICNNTREGYRPWILNKRMKAKDGTVMGRLDEFINDWCTVNLNSLIFTDYTASGLVEKNLDAPKTIYYGTYRKHRGCYFAQHMTKELTLSASKKNWKKFNEVGDAEMINKLKWTRGEEDLYAYAWSLYIEDMHTHENYAFMANRWYECLMLDVVMLFDQSCMNTFFKSGYALPPEFIIPEKMAVAEYARTLPYADMLQDQQLCKPKASVERLTCLSQVKEFLELF
jgi:hypothetical protein